MKYSKLYYLDARLETLDVSSFHPSTITHEANFMWIVIVQEAWSGTKLIVQKNKLYFGPQADRDVVADIKFDA